ncbi:MAG: nicotinate-nucleotide adenylyltransferase [Bacteroidales bacterium]|nr:nicotinate-nucleotide adenylyltransferase [Bacteroidales bacterium]
MKTGLYFGSFNPVHIGHMAIANYVVEFTDIDEVWFVLSPHNPLKKKVTLLNDYARFELLEAAIGSDNRFRASNIEFKLPKPSYTIDTLAYLREQFPKKEFTLIMGSDNLSTFNKWKNFEFIEENFTRYIYPRPQVQITPEHHKNVMVMDAPLIEISSSFIRDALKLGKNLRYFLPESVYELIDKNGYYR